MALSALSPHSFLGVDFLIFIYLQIFPLMPCVTGCKNGILLMGIVLRNNFSDEKSLDWELVPKLENFAF